MERPESTSTAWLDGEPEKRIVLHDVSWELYDNLVAYQQKHRGVRLAYLEGTLEIMSTSLTHELLKKNFARLIETWSLERNVPIAGLGEATFRKKAKKRGLQPDECYFIAESISRTASPDLAIEVVLSRWDLDKLAIYAGLGVKEVWLLTRDGIEIHVLRGDAYRRAQRSKVLPDVDLETLLRYARRDDQGRAVREYRDLLRS